MSMIDLKIHHIGKIIIDGLNLDRNVIFYSNAMSTEIRSKMKKNKYNIVLKLKDERPMNPVQSKPIGEPFEEIIDDISHLYQNIQYYNDISQDILISVISYKNTKNDFITDEVEDVNGLANEISSKIIFLLRSNIAVNIAYNNNFNILNVFNKENLSYAESIEDEVERWDITVNIAYQNSFTIKEELIDRFHISSLTTLRSQYPN